MNTLHLYNLNLPDCVFVSASLTQWSGKSALHFDKDLRINDADQIFHGTKTICPPALLKPFKAIDANLRNKLDEIGFRFMSPSVWAIPLSRISEVNDLLEIIRARLEMALDNFELNYEAACDEFFRGKEYEWELRAAKLPLDKVKKRFVFSTARFQMAQSEHSIGVDRQSLYDAFITSIAEQATEIYETWKQRNAEEVHGRSIAVLYRLLEKVKGFASMDKRAYVLKEYIQEQIKHFPIGKGLVKNKAEMAFSLLFILKEKESLSSYIEDVLLQQWPDSDSDTAANEAHAEIEDDFSLPDEVLSQLDGGLLIMSPEMTVSADIEVLPVMTLPVDSEPDDDDDDDDELPVMTLPAQDGEANDEEDLPVMSLPVESEPDDDDEEHLPIMTLAEAASESEEKEDIPVIHELTTHLACAPF